MSAPNLFDRWAVIPSYPDYEASEVGGWVRNRKTGQLKVPYESIDHRGYHRITVCMPGRRKSGSRGSKPIKVAHLVLEAWHGPRPFPGRHACHADDNSLNNDASNLRWGTPEENVQDRIRNTARREAEVQQQTAVKPKRRRRTRRRKTRRAAIAA